MARPLAAISLCWVAAAAAAGGCSGRRGPAVETATLRVHGGPDLRITSLTKPSGRLVSSWATAVAQTGSGFIGADIRFELEYPAFVRFFVVTPRVRLFTLDSRPLPPEEGYPAGTHATEVGPGPWGRPTTDGVRHCERPCYLIALASRSPALEAFSPWNVPPLAPGFSSPDSLMSWVAREVIGLPDSAGWSGTYRRLTNDQIR